jgi:hypothetical protein
VVTIGARPHADRDLPVADEWTDGAFEDAAPVLNEDFE